MTQFISAEVNIGLPTPLFVDGNSKITRDNGTFEIPVPNALSLPNIQCCPGRTRACERSCYVEGLRRNVPELFAKYQQNEQVLRYLLSLNTGPAEYARSITHLAHWISANCKGGFRWHVSGDVMHERHAMWIAKVCQRSPEVRHWIYTRTFSHVSMLQMASNLVINLSADVDNWSDAKRLADRAHLRIAYLCQDGTLPKDLPADAVIFPDYALRGRGLDEPTTSPWWQSLTAEQRKQVCPADFFGQSNAHRCGPCHKCLCPK